MVIRVHALVERVSQYLGDPGPGEDRARLPERRSDDEQRRAPLRVEWHCEQIPELIGDPGRGHCAGDPRFHRESLRLGGTAPTPRGGDPFHAPPRPTGNCLLGSSDDLGLHRAQLVPVLVAFHGQDGPMRIVALSVFERIVYHCHCSDHGDPGRPTLEVDAILREGDADGPLLVAVADYKRMAGIDAARAHLPGLREAGRLTAIDGVEYLTFPLWRAAD